MLLFASATAPGWAQQAAVCERAQAALADAIAHRDRARLERDGFEIGGLPGCDPDDVRALRRQAARILADLARAAMQSGARAEDLRARYLVARRVASVSAVLRGLAELAFAERNWVEAAASYGDLLQALEDPEPGDPKPTQEEVAAVYQRASETQMLAPLAAVRVRANRDGLPGGLDAVLIANGSRDLIARARPLPITFVFDSAELTEEGKEFAETWWSILRAGAAGTLVLAGHTDPRGPEARNERLAVQRAASIADYLRRHGFSGRILVLGFGQRCPASLSGGSEYTQEQQYQIFRRVEVIATALPPGYCGGQAPTRLSAPR